MNATLQSVHQETGLILFIDLSLVCGKVVWLTMKGMLFQ